MIGGLDGISSGLAGGDLDLANVSLALSLFPIVSLGEGDLFLPQAAPFPSVRSGEVRVLTESLRDLSTWGLLASTQESAVA